MQYNTAFALCKICLPNLARDELSDHDSENCSDVRAVTWFRIRPGLAENCRKQSGRHVVPNRPPLSVKYIYLI